MNIRPNMMKPRLNFARTLPPAFFSSNKSSRFCCHFLSSVRRSVYRSDKQKHRRSGESRG